MSDTTRKLILPAGIFAAFISIFAFGDQAMRDISSEALGRTFDYLPSVLGIGAWLSAAFLVNRLVNLLLWETLFTKLTGAQAPRLLTQLSGAGIFFLAGLGIVGIVFGQSLTGILAASGAMGIVIGLALQTMIRDVISGVALNIERPFYIGDHITVFERGFQQVSGRVEEVNWRSTRLLTPEGNLQIVPNSVLGMAVITNQSRPAAASEFELALAFDFGVESARVLRILDAALRGSVQAGGPVADPAPRAQIAAIDPHGVRYKILFHSDGRNGGPGKIKHIVLDHVLHHLQKAGLTPAYPKQDTYSAPMPERLLDYISHGPQLLARVSLFRGLTEHERHRLAKSMVLRNLSAGEVVIRHGDIGSSMFVVVEGLLEVLVPKKGSETQHKVGSVRPGDFFGEMSLLTGHPRSATVVAATTAVAFEIAKDHMAAILDSRPSVAETLSTLAAERQVALGGTATQAEAAPEKDVQSVADKILTGIRRFFGLALKPAA